MSSTTKSDFDKLKTAVEGNNVEDTINVLKNFNHVTTTRTSTTTTKDFDALTQAVIKNDVEDIKSIIQNFDVAATETKEGTNFLMVICRYCESAEVMKLALEKIEEVSGGDKALLKSQLTAADNEGFTCVMHGFRRTSSVSEEVMPLVLEKLVELGGERLLKSELSKTNKKGLTCLSIATPAYFHGMTSASYGKKRDGLKFLASVLYCLDLFREQYKNFDHNDKRGLDIFLGIDSSSWTATCDDSVETLKIVFSGLKRVGGKYGKYYVEKMLSKENDDGETMLLVICLHYSSDAERLEFVMDTIEEVGGEYLLKKQLLSKRPKDGVTCLSALRYYNSFSMLLVGRLFLIGRRFLSDVIDKNGYGFLEHIMSRMTTNADFNQDEQDKWLFLMSSLCSITDVFPGQYGVLCMEKEQKEKFHHMCKNIKSQDWVYNAQQEAANSKFGDVIGEIKKSVKNNKNLK